MTIQSPSTVDYASLYGAGSCSSCSSSWGSASASGSGASGSASQTQLSPGAKLLSKLQNLEQQDPAEFQQVTASMAESLQKEAQQAQQSGNSPEASALNQFASALASASQTGDLSPLQAAIQQQASGGSGTADVTTAVAHRHHHQDGASESTSASASTDSGTTSDPAASAGSAGAANPNVLAYQQNASPDGSLMTNLWSLFQAAEGS